MSISSNLYILCPQPSMDVDKLAVALALILIGTPSWDPEPGVVITIHSTTTNMLAPYPVQATITAEVISKALKLVGRVREVSAQSGMCENLHPKRQRGCALCEDLI